MNSTLSTVCLLSLQFLFAVVGMTFADVSHIVDGTTTTTTSYPPRPYQFSYEAGRYPGHVDRKYSKALLNWTILNKLLTRYTLWSWWRRGNSSRCFLICWPKKRSQNSRIHSRWIWILSTTLSSSAEYKICGFSYSTSLEPLQQNRWEKLRS